MSAGISDLDHEPAVIKPIAYPAHHPPDQKTSQYLAPPSAQPTLKAHRKGFGNVAEPQSPAGKSEQENEKSVMADS